MPYKTAAALTMSTEQHRQLEAMSRSKSLPHRQVVQAQALLRAADGTANEQIAREVGTTPDTVRRWRSRFSELGVSGVGKIAAGRGRKTTLTPAMVAQILQVTTQARPTDTGTHWTSRMLARRMGIGKDVVVKVWKAHGLQPWRFDTFKLSNDPRFEEKLVDVVGLYLNPPKRAVVFSFDEKPQCQAPPLPVPLDTG